MRNVLAFDTETSGLLARSPIDGKVQPLDHPDHPHLLQLGFVLVDADDDWREVTTFRSMIAPDGWSVSKEALAIHGITAERASRYGMRPRVAIAALIEAARKASYRVAHNDDFDVAITRIEIIRHKSDDLGVERRRIRALDPMKIGATISTDGAYPSLAALYLALTGEKHTDLHDGLSDARAALRCVRVLVDRGVIEL